MDVNWLGSKFTKFSCTKFSCLENFLFYSLHLHEISNSLDKVVGQRSRLSRGLTKGWLRCVNGSTSFCCMLHLIKIEYWAGLNQSISESIQFYFLVSGSMESNQSNLSSNQSTGEAPLASADECMVDVSEITLPVTSIITETTTPPGGKLWHNNPNYI